MATTFFFSFFNWHFSISTSVKTGWSWFTRCVAKRFLYVSCITFISSGGRICGHKEAFHQELVGSSDQLYIQVGNFIQPHVACLLMWMLFAFAVERGSKERMIWLIWNILGCFMVQFVISRWKRVQLWLIWSSGWCQQGLCDSGQRGRWLIGDRLRTPSGPLGDHLRTTLGPLGDHLGTKDEGGG